MSWPRPWRGSSAPDRASGRRALLAGLLAALALASLLLVVRWPVPPAALPVVRGVLIDLRVSSLMYATQITLRADDGQLWMFQVDPEVATNREEPQSASHLRQHMAFGDPMLVRYRETTDGPLAVRIVDAR